MIKVIIFDLDGTLVNLNLDFEKLLSKIQALLQTHEELSPFLEAIIKHTENNLSLRKKAYEIIDEMEQKSINNLQIFPETVQVLNDLKSRGDTLALVTLQGRKAVDLILQKYSLTNIFNSIITRENSHLRSEQIDRIITLLKIPKPQVLMVGDRLNDVKASKKVGINWILVRRQYTPLEGSIVIKSLSEIFQYL